jgi:alpha-tubulin suppressor-like RCC1 family protein
MKTSKSHLFRSIVSMLVLALSACGGGNHDGGKQNEGNGDDDPGAVIRTGYAVDDYIVGGTVTIYQNNTDQVIETTTTGDRGKFQWSDKVKGVVRIEITGGHEDIDGLAATTNDHVPFTRKLVLLLNADTLSTPAIVSPITTGIAAYADGDISKYALTVDALDPSLKTLVVSSADDAQLLQTLTTIQATTRYLGYDSIVSELSDDGAFNNSAGTNAQEVGIITNAASAQGDIAVIADPGLRACISDRLEKEVSAITKSDLMQITNLHCSGYNITSVAGVDALVKLEVFISSGSDISDISPFANISTLGVLSVIDNRIASIAPLLQAKFSELELQIAGNCITDIPLLASAVNISYLYGNPNRQYSDCYKNDADVLTFKPYVTKTGEYLLVYRATYNPAAVCSIDWGDGTTSAAQCDFRVYYASHDYSSAPTKPVGFLVNGEVKVQKSFPGTCPDGQTLQNDKCTPNSGIVYTQVATGERHTCGLTQDGAVLCWGDNTYGQLGQGAERGGRMNTPIKVLGVTGATAISAGLHNTCAVITGGSVKCWGGNSADQLGVLDPVDVPVTAQGVAGATAISVGRSHTCALITGGSVQCWGENRSFQLGLGNAVGTPLESSPATVPGITGAIAISAGDKHTCALFTGGAVQCWGDNINGALGYPVLYRTQYDSRYGTPVNVVDLMDATAISAGTEKTCAVVVGGAVRCWGYVGLGAGGTNVIDKVPVMVQGITGATAIATSLGHTCALVAGGAMRCWGQEDSGLLNPGEVYDGRTAATVPGITGATAIGVADARICAVITGGAVQCWGSNAYGELGLGDYTDRSTPATVVGSGGG